MQLTTLIHILHFDSINLFKISFTHSVTNNRSPKHSQLTRMTAQQPRATWLRGKQQFIAYTTKHCKVSVVNC